MAAIEIEQLLKDTEIVDNDKYKIVQEVREIVHKVYPEVKERIMYGGIMFSLEKDFGGVFVSKKHVSLEFSLGYLLEDPKNLLEGTGKYRRHLKLKTIQDIKDKEIPFFLNQVAI